MRIFVLIAFVMSAVSVKGQTYMPGLFANNRYSRGFTNKFTSGDSTQKKWFITRHSAISASYNFFRGGSASVIAAPVGLQLNRKLNDNLYAFANATIAPAYINFNRSFLATDFIKSGQTNFFKPSGFGMYSSASLGLFYANNEKTFSLSGSISVEKSNYPLLPYYGNNMQRPDRANGTYR